MQNEEVRLTLGSLSRAGVSVPESVRKTLCSLNVPYSWSPIALPEEQRLRLACSMILSADLEALTSSDLPLAADYLVAIAGYPEGMKWAIYYSDRTAAPLLDYSQPTAALKRLRRQCRELIGVAHSNGGILQ